MTLVYYSMTMMVVTALVGSGVQDMASCGELGVVQWAYDRGRIHPF